jgi:RNA polymerase sigma-70 factor (ECF subfamily)
MKFINDNINMTEEKKREAFDKLFKESKAKLYNVAFNVVKNQSIAEEVLQDAYLKAWRNFDQYDSNKKFINWMTTIVHNAGIDTTRQRPKNTQVYSLNSISSQLNGDKNQVLSLDAEDKSFDLYKTVENKEFIERIVNSINEMSEDLKVVMIPFVEGQSYDEISNSSSLALTTVRARVHRGKQILRKSFGSEFSMTV